MKMSDFLLYEFKISLQLTKKVIIVINIVEEDKRWRCCHMISMTWWNQMVCMVFFSPFGDVCPLCKYDLLEEENPSYLMHNLWYMDVIF